MEKIRLNKYLAQTQNCSRRQADALIARGTVSVNGRPAELGELVSEEDQIEVGGKKAAQEKRPTFYYAFHKPFGVITTMDPEAPDSIREFVEKLNLPVRIFPIGRLDVESSGLLLFTNDGGFTHRLTHAKFGFEKEYTVDTTTDIDDDALETMRHGMDIGDALTRAARVERLGTAKFRIIIKEGRNRQIRRMCETLGYEVKKLLRVRVGSVELGTLRPREWRRLTEKELEGFEEKKESFERKTCR